MYCEKCGYNRIPPKTDSMSLVRCPVCGTPVLNIEKAKSLVSLSKFLQYIVEIYGTEIYKEGRRLYNIIDDLYSCDERRKRLYRRAILDDALSQRIYELSLKPSDKQEDLHNQLIIKFVKDNLLCSYELGKQIVDDFIAGLPKRFIDEFNVIYSVDGKKLIRGNKLLESYKIRKSTVIICDDAFIGCKTLKSIIMPDTIKQIGHKAFSDCVLLKKVSLPQSILKIYSDSFSPKTRLIYPKSLLQMRRQEQWPFICAFLDSMEGKLNFNYPTLKKEGCRVVFDIIYYFFIFIAFYAKNIWPFLSLLVFIGLIIRYFRPDSWFDDILFFALKPIFTDLFRIVGCLFYISYYVYILIIVPIMMLRGCIGYG